MQAKPYNPVSIEREIQRADTRRYSSIAHLISNLISPPILALCTLLLVAVRIDSLEGYVWTAIFTCIAVVFPLGYITYLLRTGYLTDFFMRVREERIRPMIFIVLCAMVATVVLFFGEAPKLLKLVSLAVIGLNILFLIVTKFWKISAHGATVSACTVLYLYFFGWMGIPCLLMIPLVGWSRIYLSRHTMLQVLLGSAVGVFSVVVTMSLGEMVQ